MAQPATPTTGTCLVTTDQDGSPDTANTLPEGAACATGANPTGGQHLFRWTPPTDDPGPWTFRVSPVPGQLAVLEIYSVEQDASGTVTSATKMVSVRGAANTETVATDLLLTPANWYVGIAFSGPGAYQLTIEPGDRSASQVSASDTPLPVDADFALSGAITTTPVTIAWTLDAAAATRHHDLLVQTAAGQSLTWILTDATGASLATGGMLTNGRLTLPDLGLNAGTYTITLSGSFPEATPWRVVATATTPRAASVEDEPNDTSTTGTIFDVQAGSGTMTGRLALSTGFGDIDTYQLNVTIPLAGHLTDIRLIWRNGLTRTLCLVDANGAQLRCVDGTTGAALSDLVLAVGSYGITVSGDPDPNGPYTLKVDVTGELPTGFEAEPNDTPALASQLAPDGDTWISAGRLQGTERDHFRMTATGDPQLWRIDVTGPGVGSVSLLTPSGMDVSSVSATNGVATLWDAFLLPGDHVIAVSGSGGDYTVTVTPLGPPDPLAEHEPNDTADRSQPTRLFEPRTGRLATVSDVDDYRFSLQASTYLTIDLTIPTDQVIRAYVSGSSSTAIAVLSADTLGDDLHWSGLMPAGDYLINLTATSPGTDRYTLTLTPGDPFTTPVDLEPNDDEYTARPAPADGQFSGVLDQSTTYGDVDWYILPPRAAISQLPIAWSPTVQLRVWSAGSGTNPSTELILIPGAEAGIGTVDIPPDATILLQVSGQGPYDIAIGGTVPLLPAASPEASPVTLSEIALSLTLDASPPAAFWTDAQGVNGTLTVTNTGSGERSLNLTARTGNQAWRVEMAHPSLTIAGGQTATVPVTIHLAPDAWADAPIYIAIAASENDAVLTSTLAFITPSSTSAPLNVEAWSPLPAQITGGLDVAWVGLGATPVTTDDTARADQMQALDQLLIVGTGIHADAASLPAEFTVDLVGDDPIPVAGAIFFPAGVDPSPDTMAGDVELQLSDDGVTFTTVITAHLRPDSEEQAFSLEQPVNARFARLRIIAAQSRRATIVSLGEWKVVADPVWSPASGPANLADPDVGGHVVDLQPPVRDILAYQSLLTADGQIQTLIDGTSNTASWIVGFHNDRAARITGITWVDPPGSDPTSRIGTVTVEVATESPVGSWTSLGTFDLQRNGDGTATITFDQPTWARFVRFTGTRVAPASDATPPASPTALELPDQITITEAPVSDSYHSILGEWGTFNANAVYEQQVTPVPITLDPDAGNSAETATNLVPDITHTDSAAITVDEDWYSITMPPGDGTLEVTLTGIPALGVTATLSSQEGDDIPLDRTSPTATSVTFTANVSPGKTYRLHVTQPPTSVIFAFDTSASIGALESAVYQALTRFAGDVLPGRESVNIVPFGEQLLLETWSDQPYELQSTIANYPRTSMSSDAEGAIVTSNQALVARDGTRAIFLITDAESGPALEVMGQLWPGLAATVPRIISVQIAGGTTSGSHPQDLMQDWAMVNNGDYHYVRTQGEMDIAFNRAAAELRRPAIYTITAETSPPQPTPTPLPTATPLPTPTPAPTPTAVPTPTPEPTATPAADGTLKVLAPLPVAGQPSSLPAASTGNVAIILDTSGSMLQALDNSTRAEVARSALTDLVTTTIPAGTTVSLRTFGDTPDSCDTILVVPPGPLDPTAMAATIAGVPVVNLVKTPIGASLLAVRDDLGTGDGPKIVVLVTDGEETCGGDPAAAIQQLIDSGIDVRVNIVGFAIDDPALTSTFEEWARIGNGQYIDAGSASELNTAVAQAVMPTYDVVDTSGNVVASGQVGADPIAVAPGTYSIVIHSTTEITIANVTVISGQPLEVPAPTGP